MHAPQPQATVNDLVAVPPLSSPQEDLRGLALEALCGTDIDAKLARVQALWHDVDRLRLSAHAVLPPPAGEFPGRPSRPPLTDPSRVPQRSPFTLEGRAALLHAICHIEFNAIHLALDAVWRFAGMPPDFYRDWLRIAAEEAHHFTLLRDLLRRLPHPHPGAHWDYGDFLAHDGLWTMCEKTAGDIVARMALVPRTLEARGLDATPLIQSKLRQVGTPDALEAVGLLDIILHDEIGHVAVGNRWYRWLCEREGLDPVAHYRGLARRHAAPRLRPPFNDEARLRAGFSREELDFLAQAL
jgi:uncharacterized ferritin-like protein (DUF455 family)